MYITVTKQHMDATFSQSVSDFVNYLEKENEGRSVELQEHFFDQYNNRLEPGQVIKEIDGNTAKLKKKEPKFYSLTINPSQSELKAINNDPALLRLYVREAMKDYAASFHRDRPVTVDDIKYFAKIEHERTFKGFDRLVKENRVYMARIAKLENSIRKVERGELKGSTKKIRREIEALKAGIPHRIDGQIVQQGMKKPGLQTHVHIIVSRKDVTNRFSLSPGSKYMESESTLNGKKVMRGFKRDQFFERAERTFDKLFGHDRNYVQTYAARKTYTKDPYLYFAKLMKLPTNEKSMAFKILGKAGVSVPDLNIPKNQVELAVKTFQQLKKVMKVAQNAGSIGI